MSKDKGKLIRVATAPNPVIAASWQEVLRSEGIPSMVKVEDALGVAYLVSSFYPCGIYVVASEADRASQILDGLAEEEDEEDQEDRDEVAGEEAEEYGEDDEDEDLPLAPTR